MSDVRRGASSSAFGADRVKRDAPLAPFTTFKVGGPADLLLETQNADEIVRRCQARARGRRAGDDARRRIERADRRPRHSRSGDPAEGRRGRRRSAIDLVRADAAVTINGLVRWTINRGYAGLEAWAGTPGTVGGAIYGNAHWKKTNIGDLVESVRLLKPDGTLLQAPADRMEFDYDYSRLQAHRRDRAVGGVSRDAGRRSGGAARGGARVAGVPEAHAAARVAERRLHLHESRSGRAIACPTAFRRRPARWSIAPASRARRSAARASRRRTPTSSSTTARPPPPTSARSSSGAATAVNDQFGVTLRNEIICLGEFDAVSRS